MAQFLLGILASIIAAAVIAVLVQLTGFGRSRLKRLWQQRGLLRRMAAAGVSNFYASRAEYQSHRGAPGLTDYLATAHTSIKAATYWMAHGNEAEGAARVIADLVQQKNLEVDIAVIDPQSPHIAQLSEYLDIELEELRLRIRSSIARLLEARERLSPEAKTRLRIRSYQNLPIASVIMLDTDTDEGRVQLDIKPYRTPRDRSFGIELTGPDGPLYQTVRDAWTQLVESAPEVDPATYLYD